MEPLEQNELVLTARKIERHLRAIYIAVYWVAICVTFWAIFEMAQTITGLDQSTAELIAVAACAAFGYAAHHAERGSGRSSKLIGKLGFKQD